MIVDCVECDETYNARPNQWYCSERCQKRALARAARMGLRPESVPWARLAILFENNLPQKSAWMKQAACRGCNPDLFFPTRGDNAQVKEAKAICARCPVRSECLEHALDTGESLGVWGGMSERQRKTERRRRRVQQEQGAA